MLGNALEFAFAFETLFIARICCFRAVLPITWGNLDSPGLHYPLSQESSSAGAEASWVKPQFFPFRNNWLPPRAHGQGKDYSSPGQVGSGSTNSAREASRKAPRQTKAKRSRRSCHHTGCYTRDFHPGHSLPRPVPTDTVWPLVPLQHLLSHFITSGFMLCFNLNNPSTINRIPRQILKVSKCDIYPHHTDSLLAIPLRWFPWPACSAGWEVHSSQGRTHLARQDLLLAWSSNPENKHWCEFTSKSYGPPAETQTEATPTMPSKTGKNPRIVWL